VRSKPLGRRSAVDRFVPDNTAFRRDQRVAVRAQQTFVRSIHRKDEAFVFGAIRRDKWLID
jgi:hypothetical protein